MFNQIEDLSWELDEKEVTQSSICWWLESVITKDDRGQLLQDIFQELLPPETLLSPSAINGSKDPRIRKEVRDVIQV